MWPRQSSIFSVMKRVLAVASLASFLACTRVPSSISTTPISPHGGSGFSPPATLPVCPFGIGDSVTRAGGGATVPERGQAVGGNFDGVNQSGSIQIETGLDGVVTIKSKVTGQAELVEICQLR
jgi:hypothetical protein